MKIKQVQRILMTNFFFMLLVAFLLVGDFTTTTLSSGDEQRTYKIMIILEDNTENHKVTQKTVKFTLGKAITEAKCSDFGEYVTDGGIP